MMTSTIPDIDSGAADRDPPARLDLAHLANMTLGNRRLESEVLELFLQQAPLLAERVRGAALEAPACVHTLKGSARGIGAWHLAAAAERMEQAATAADRDGATAQLLRAVEDACTAVRERLRHG